MTKLNSNLLILDLTLIKIIIKMNEIELINLISDLGINKETDLALTYIEKGNEINRRGRIEFFINDLPAIKEGVIGVRIEIVRGSLTPLVGGLKLSDLISIKLYE